MSGETKYPAGQMLAKALSFMSLIVDVCERVQIAGSLRREKAMVGDIELVAIPKFKGSHNLLDIRCADLLRTNHITKRLNKNNVPIAWGKMGDISRYKAMIFANAPIDLFIVLPDRQWGPTFLIRTGPGDANEALVTQDGWVNQHGIRGTLPEYLSFRDGAIWRGDSRLDTPEEADVFDAVGMPYIQPNERSVQEYQLWGSRRQYKGVFEGVRSSMPVLRCELAWTVAPAWKDTVAIEDGGEQMRLVV